MSLRDKLRRPERPVTSPRREPLWTGPNGDGDNGGVTQGLISKYLSCRERFRIRFIEGLKPADRFNHHLEYGNLWHVCEEEYAKDDDGRWETCLLTYVRDLCRRYPLQQGEIDKWYSVCKIQFPEYVKFWGDHPDVIGRTPLLQEQVFDVPYRLPSGRMVRLRGKLDAVDLVEPGICTCGADRTGPSAEVHVENCPANGPWTFRDGKLHGGIYLFETKTKGDIREEQIKRQLTFDLQTMLYLIALDEAKTVIDFEKGPEIGDVLERSSILGVRYNVIRRPLSGGKGTIVRNEGTPDRPCGSCGGTGRTKKKGLTCTPCAGGGLIRGNPPETKEAYYERLAAYIKDEPETYFMRWSVGVTPGDLERFRREFLDPVLENMLDDYEWWIYCHENGATPFIQGDRNRIFPHHCPRHYRHPFGAKNWIDDGGSSDLDAYLESGSTAGLERSNVLFPELV